MEDPLHYKTASFADPFPANPLEVTNIASCILHVEERENKSRVHGVTRWIVKHNLISGLKRLQLKNYELKCFEAQLLKSYSF